MLDMNLSQRDQRALRLLLILVVLGWVFRSHWWPLREIEEAGSRSVQSQGRSRAPYRRQQRRQVVDLSIAALPRSLFDFEQVSISSRAVPPRAPGIVLSEIHYHPADPNGDAEFIELSNASEAVVDLSGWSLSRGVEFTFSPGLVLNPQESAVVCRDLTAFRAAFPGQIRILGEYTGGLKNSGERIQIRDGQGEVSLDLSYSDERPWAADADGKGDSLQIRGLGLPSADPVSWRASPPSPGLSPEVNEGVGKLSFFDMHHQPKRPKAGEDVSIFATLSGEEAGISLALVIEVNGERQVFPLPESAANEQASILRLFEANLGSLAQGTMVRYWFQSIAVEAAVEPEGKGQRWPNADRAISNKAFFVSPKSNDSVLPRYNFLIAPRDMQRLHENPRSNETVPVSLVYQGEVYDRLQMRIRGAYARSWPKKSYRVIFHREQLFRGRNRLNLNSAWRDPAMVREVLAYRIYREAGSYSLRSRLVRVDVNNVFWGLYVDVEQPDKRSLEKLGLENAALYKADSSRNRSDERYFDNESVYQQHYRKETNEEEPFTDLASFCRQLASPNAAELWSDPKVRQRILNYLCATAIIQNWDGFNKNHHIGFEDNDSRRWFLLPWDLDRTLGDSWNWRFDETSLSIWLGTAEHPGVTGWNRVFDAVLKDPAMRREYRNRLQELLQEVFTADWIKTEIAALGVQMSRDADQDRKRWGGEQDWETELNRLEKGLLDRRQFILKQL